MTTIYDDLGTYRRSIAERHARWAERIREGGEADLRDAYSTLSDLAREAADEGKSEQARVALIEAGRAVIDAARAANTAAQAFADQLELARRLLAREA